MVMARLPASTDLSAPKRLGQSAGHLAAGLVASSGSETARITQAAAR